MTNPNKGQLNSPEVEPADEDPRAALARRYLQQAEEELEDDTLSRGYYRGAKSDSKTKPPAAAGLSLQLDNSIWLHLILASIGFTIAAMACLLCYHLLHLVFVAARAIAIPVGLVTAAILSYVSMLYLGIIESTSYGKASLEDAMAGDWREWFWTLPTSLGPLVVAGVCGWLISLGEPELRWTIILLSMFFLYPILLISVLANGSFVALFSRDVWRSLMTNLGAWVCFYLVSFAMVSIVATVIAVAWRDPPYATLLFAGPTVTVVIFVYAWMLGQLVRNFNKDLFS